MTEAFNSNADVLAEACKEKWIYRLRGTSQYVLGKEMARLISILKSLLINRIAVQQKFEEWIGSRIIPEAVIAKTGWLVHHGHEAWYVCPRKQSSFPSEDPKLMVGEVGTPHQTEYVLDPIQCVSLYHALYDSKLSKLPLKIYEHQAGLTYRHEDNATGFPAGLEFMRIEFVWIAKKEEAIDIRNKLASGVADLFAEQLWLKLRIARGDSCFEEPAIEGYADDSLFERDNEDSWNPLPSVDVVVLFDNADPHLEVASAGRSDVIPRRFQISTEDKSCLWSGCLGVGLTRVAFAFLRQHGFQANAWPDTQISKLFKRDYVLGIDI